MFYSKHETNQIRLDHQLYLDIYIIYEVTGAQSTWGHSRLRDLK